MAELSAGRAFTAPEPGEDWAALATRVLPELPQDEALEKLQSWNLHLFARHPRGQFLGSDVVFTAPPAA
ncbi:MAG: hypothetical protein ISQ03_03940 [Pseudomonadales bacterium]|jgi:hypothetical protein|nr:hypothetical protein [Pseudomonadales bacterium]